MITVRFNSQCSYHKSRCKCSYRNSALAHRPTRYASTIPSDAFDPFDTLVESGPDHSRLHQELLFWNVVTLNPGEETSIPIKALAKTLLDCWWAQAMTDGAFYYSFATEMMKVRSKLTGESSGSRQTYFRSLAITRLRKSLLDYAANADNQAAALTIAMHMDFAIGDDESVEADAHAKALATICTAEFVRSSLPAHWLTLSHAALKYAMWASKRMPISYMVHPAFHYTLDSFSDDALSLSHNQATSLCDVLPPFTNCYEYFRKFFLIDMQAGHIVGLLHDLLIDLCADAVEVRRRLRKDSTHCQNWMHYGMLLSLQLAAYAPNSFSPFSKTVCEISWAMPLLKQLTQILDAWTKACPFLDMEEMHRRCFVWIASLTWAFGRLAERLEPGKPVEIASANRSYLTESECNVFHATFDAILPLFPMYASLWRYHRPIIETLP